MLSLDVWARVSPIERVSVSYPAVVSAPDHLRTASTDRRNLVSIARGAEITVLPMLLRAPTHVGAAANVVALARPHLSARDLRRMLRRHGTPRTHHSALLARQTVTTARAGRCAPARRGRHGLSTRLALGDGGSPHVRLTESTRVSLSRK